MYAWNILCQWFILYQSYLEEFILVCYALLCMNFFKFLNCWKHFLIVYKWFLLPIYSLLLGISFPFYSQVIFLWFLNNGILFLPLPPCSSKLWKGGVYIWLSLILFHFNFFLLVHLIGHLWRFSKPAVEILKKVSGLLPINNCFK